ncbi:FAD-dependent oxidoreductase [Rickettsiales bacterium]|nr:FAD-dependent oxidoreductase [Rickettsiales bacterium]
MIFIIGAGINGLSIGIKLVNNGFKVKIFDFQLKGESSLAAVGMLAPLIEARPYEDELLNLMLDSKKRWFNFAKKIIHDSKINIDYKQNSSLLIANNYNDIEKLKFKKKFIEKLGFKTDLLDKEQTLKIEPMLSEDVQASLFCKGQDQVNPILLKKSLLKLFRAKGGIIETKKKISKIFLKKNKVGVLLGQKDFFASKIIIASGVWSHQILLDSFDLSIPLKPVKGVSLRIKSQKNKQLINHNLWFKNIYVAPRDNGELMVGATEEEKGYETFVNTKEIYYLTKNLWENLPFTENYEIVNFTTGLRPTSFDGLPIIGTLDFISKDIICAFGHFRHGVLLAPITSDIVHNCIVDDNKNKKFFPFSPNRYHFNE